MMVFWDINTCVSASETPKIEQYNLRALPNLA